MWDLLTRAHKYVAREEEKKNLASKSNQNYNGEQRFSENQRTESIHQMKKEESKH